MTAWTIAEPLLIAVSAAELGDPSERALKQTNRIPIARFSPAEIGVEERQRRV
jgi:hypothetical protein